MDKNIPLTHEVVKDALDQMKGAVMIVYPMGLPPHDPVRQELENTEDFIRYTGEVESNRKE